MIEFRGVVKRFGARVVLNHLSFAVDQGEILFVLGTSGTGKSVTLKLIVGLLDADEGEIWVDAQNVTRFSEVERMSVRRKCGMVFQQPALFDALSIFENVAFGLKRHFKLTAAETEERVARALSLVRLSGFEGKMPAQISYGMQKRASLARSIALEPKALLFDEPTTGLDPVTTTAVNRLIKDLSRELKTTSVVVSHDMRCALDIADRIVMLDKGQVVAQGTPEQLRASTVPLVRDFLAEVT